MADSGIEKTGVRMAEVVASLSLATDLATGQPLEQGLRRALLATWLAEDLDISADDLSGVYYVALLGAVGCILDGAALAEYVRDEIETNEKMMVLDSSRKLQMASFFFSQTKGRGLTRVRRFFSVARQSQRVCRDVALHVGGLLDLGPSIKAALGQCDEHWDGNGGIIGLSGEDIQLPARLFLLCHDVEIFNRIGGAFAALEVVRDRAGTFYDPDLAQRFLAVGEDYLARLQNESLWEAVLEREPRPHRVLTPFEFEDVAGKIASFVDVRSPFTVGHSAGVAKLAEATAQRLGLAEPDVRAIRYAGLLHDLGRSAVPASLWNSPDPLNAEAWDRMKRHAATTELVLSRSNSLGHIGAMAGMHHERLDGTGYRGITAASLPVSARILAAADCLQTKLEARPYRPAMPLDHAARHLESSVNDGGLDVDVVRALLVAAGQAPEKRSMSLPAGLTDREAEVLRLLVRGLPNREIAEVLVVSPKTVGHHIESIYNKIGVSTRVGATLFAVQHGLIENAG